MSTIICRTCSSPMVTDRCESSGSATTCWHQCPVCKQVRLTSENQRGRHHHTANYHPDDDGALAGDSDAHADVIADTLYETSYTL